VDLDISLAEPGEAGEISALICGLAQAFTLHPEGEGAEPFFASLSPAAIEDNIRDPRFAYYVGRAGGRLAGVVAVRDHDHLFHLFVASELQGRGVGRRLWERARADSEAAGERSRFTVNSTPGAVEVYERFGFRVAGERVETSGIAYVPMRLDLGRSARPRTPSTRRV
jgi:ribosomal protein S18 acetylase RimI-like enzyme